MTYKHDFVDDYPYLAYSSIPDAVQANPSDISTLDGRLDDIEAAGWVTSTRIAAKAVTTAKIDDAAVDTAQIKDNAVTTPKIKDGAVTSDKIASA